MPLTTRKWVKKVGFFLIEILRCAQNDMGGGIQNGKICIYLSYNML